MVNKQIEKYLMKNILFITTIYRQGERIYPILPQLSNHYKIDLLQINEMSNDMDNYGNIDNRNLFHKEYDSCFNNIIDGTIKSIESKGARNDNPSDVIKNLDVDKYDMIIYDDDRNRHGINSIYNRVKNKIPLIGNVHGNFWYPDSGKSNIKNCYDKVFNKAFVLGEKEKKAHYPNDYILSGGIPSNDELKYYDRTDDFILIIVNFLGNMKGILSFTLLYIEFIPCLFLSSS